MSSVPERLPRVAIVGRPNVGKSALFNRLAQRRISIVHDQPGVTRDRLHALCHLGNRLFEIVDTGGIGGGAADEFGDATAHEAELAIEIADAIVLVVDAKDGVTPVDAALASRLRRAGKPLILAINKVDHERHRSLAAEFEQLGIDPALALSAAHGSGVEALVRETVVRLPLAVEDATDPQPDGPSAVRVAIAGRPNVGKSSLMNAILGEPRAIVSEVAGTTRDSVDTPFRFEGRNYVLVDTAGLRHQRKHRTSVEVFSAMRSRENIATSDLCVLVIDATAGVTSQDKQIAGAIQENARPCVVAVSKWDLARPERGAREACHKLERDIAETLFFLGHAPAVPLSSLTGENVPRLLREIRRVELASARHIETGRFNRLLQDVQTTNPPPLKGTKRLKIFYGTQAAPIPGGVIPPPTFVLFVNQPGLLTPAYGRYLERRIREVEAYPGLPIRLRLRGRSAVGRQEPRPDGHLTSSSSKAQTPRAKGRRTP